MTTALSVGIGALEDLGVHLSTAAATITAPDAATPLDSVVTALPGSRTATSAVGLALQLAASIELVGERLATLATSASDTAASYGTSDTCAGERMVTR